MLPGDTVIATINLGEWKSIHEVEHSDNKSSDNRGLTLFYATDQVLKMSPLFAPAHELGRQIHVINAYCREAEILRDPMQNSLWDLLDQLIEVHDQVAPKSLFAGKIMIKLHLPAKNVCTIALCKKNKVSQCPTSDQMF